MQQYHIHAGTARFGHLVERTRARIAQMLAEHPNCYIALSGGKDSVALAHLVNRIRPTPSVSWMDDLEWPETEQLVRGLASRWELKVVRRDGLWEQLVAIGLSPFDHNYFYDRRLVPKSRRDCVRDYDAVFLGLRADESAGRRVNAAVRGDAYSAGRQVHLCPLQRWTSRDIFAYLVAHGLPIHPVYQKRSAVFEPERSIRVSWWIPSPGVSRHGYCAWLRQHYRDRWRQLIMAFPEGRAYA